MSTLAVGTIKSISSAAPAFQNTSGTEIGQLAKVWVNFDGSFGTSPFTEANGGIRDSFNVSSVTDNGTGDYTVNFSNSIGSSDYCTLCTCADPGTANIGTNIKTDTTPTASLVRVSSATQYTTVVDPTIFCVAIFG
tara:strand:+ start:2357 stop:2764 length:408 start_codon:yes stop_codon:yes gene_type:complete